MDYRRIRFYAISYLMRFIIAALAINAIYRRDVDSIGLLVALGIPLLLLQLVDQSFRAVLSPKIKTLPLENPPGPTLVGERPNWPTNLVVLVNKLESLGFRRFDKGLDHDNSHPSVILFDEEKKILASVSQSTFRTPNLPFSPATYRFGSYLDHPNQEEKRRIALLSETITISNFFLQAEANLSQGIPNATIDELLYEHRRAVSLLQSKGFIPRVFDFENSKGMAEEGNAHAAENLLRHPIRSYLQGLKSIFKASQHYSSGRLEDQPDFAEKIERLLKT